MTRSSHVCRYWQPTRGGHRGWRWCNFCGRRQAIVARKDGRVWEDIHTLEWFAERWLPAISGTKPERMMNVQVAFPFEFNGYETWNVVYRVVFQFPTTEGRLLTRIHVMNGWQSTWHQCWNRIDAEAEAYYLERTNRPYDIGDNTYAEMREVIQSGVIAPKPTVLHAVPTGDAGAHDASADQAGQQ